MQKSNTQVNIMPALKPHHRALYALLAIIIVLITFFIFEILSRKQSSSPIYKSHIKELSDDIYITHDYKAGLILAESILRMNPSDSQALLMKGVAQFYLDDLTQAKATFDQVLAIDPSSESAKYYKAKLNSNVNLITSTSPVQKISQQEVEFEIHMKFDSKMLTFRNATRLPLNTNQSEFISAVYQSSQSKDKTMIYLKSAVKAGKDDTVKVVTNAGASYVEKYNSATKAHTILFAQSVGKSVVVMVSYSKDK